MAYVWENPPNATPTRFASWKNVCTFASGMYLSKAKKYRYQRDGTAIAYEYYRLTESYIDKDGKTKHHSVLCLRELSSFDKEERNRLVSTLTTI